MTLESSTAGGSIPTSSTRWDSSWPRLLSAAEKQQRLQYFRDRFGIPLEAFTPFEVCQRGPNLWLVSGAPHLLELAALKVEAVGLMLLRIGGRAPKPTSAALQLFGRYANRNTVPLSWGQLRQLVLRGEVHCSFRLEPGHVIVKLKDGLGDDMVVGCALFKGGRLINQFPRGLFAEVDWPPPRY